MRRGSDQEEYDHKYLIESINTDESRWKWDDECSLDLRRVDEEKPQEEKRGEKSGIARPQVRTRGW